MSRALGDDIFREPFWLAFIIFIVAAGTILSALGFEHIGGYQPCALCLQERIPYYVGIPLAGAAAAASYPSARKEVIVLLFAALALLMLGSAALGVYHSGVEWKWWPGPSGCAASVTVENAGSVLDTLRSGVHSPSCTEAVWRFAGLSFAGWNVVVSLVLAGLAGLAAYRAYGSSSASQ